MQEPKPYKEVAWTPEKLALFKHKYERARAANIDETFTFEGNVYVIAYAKYLIEHLEVQFGQRR